MRFKLTIIGILLGFCAFAQPIPTNAAKWEISLNDTTWVTNVLGLKQVFASADMPLEPAINQTGEGIFMTAINAGTTITAFDCVYLGSAGTWLLTDADAASTSLGLLAIAMQSRTSTQLTKVALPGTIIRNDSWNWATVGAPIYLSVTSGALTQTITTGTNKVVRVVGYALTDDCIYFNPSPNYITLN